MRKLIIVVACGLTIAACKSKEEQIQEAQEQGSFLVEKKTALIKGVGEALKGKGKQSAEAVSEGVGEVVKGVGAGFDRSLSEVKVRAADTVTAAGIAVQRATREHGRDERKEGREEAKNVSVYLTFAKAFEGKLRLKAVDGEGRETGRAEAEVKEAADGARFVDFTFDVRTPLTNADHFELGLVRS